jgi:hypothetical protein
MGAPADFGTFPAMLIHLAPFQLVVPSELIKLVSKVAVSAQADASSSSSHVRTVQKYFVDGAKANPAYDTAAESDEET